MDQTARFALPYLAPGQMQKELHHNEALQRIDMLLSPAVEGPPAQTPPAGPAVGACFLVADGATGAWTGEDGSLACLTEAGWRFVTPVDGTSVVDRGSGHTIMWRNGAWETGVVRAQEVHIDGLAVLRNRQPAIADPSGGTVIDVECRSAVAAILSSLKAHGLIA